MKYFLALSLLFQSLFCLANSASPFFAGTNAGSAYSSRDVDILKEKIILDLDRQAHMGFYSITYDIRTDKEGKQIPLLFNAMNYAVGFKVWVDDKPVSILAISRGNSDSLHRILRDFGDVYLKPQKQNDQLPGSQPDTTFTDYKYFEVPLTKGEHTIHIEYIASPSGSHQTWVNEYDLDYSLWPASHWRSFGSLEIELHADSTNKKIETSLGIPIKTTRDTLVWKFDKLPMDIFRISYTPKLGWFADAMIGFGPFGFAICFTLILLLIHAKLIGYERKTSTHTFSWVTILGGLIMPVFIFIAYFCFFDMIFAVIGAEASHRNNSMYAIFLYPPVAITYFILICIVDWLIRLRNSKRAAKVASMSKG